MMTLLAEVLDKGPSFIQQPILQTLYCILQYVDLAVIQAQVGCFCDGLFTVAVGQEDNFLE